MSLTFISISSWRGVTKLQMGYHTYELFEVVPLRRRREVLQVRAERRYRELLAKGNNIPFETVLAEANRRDEQDSTRADSPLTYDESYTVIDTSELSIPEVVAAIVARVRR
jgi:hypothetical protein